MPFKAAISSWERVTLYQGIYFLSHPFFAAFAAICERFLDVNLVALAAPPMSPPKSHLWSFTDRFEKHLMASWFGSWGRALLERHTISQYDKPKVDVNGSKFKIDPPPEIAIRLLSYDARIIGAFFGRMFRRS